MKWIYGILIVLMFSCKSEVIITEEDINASVLYIRGSYKPYSGRCMVLFNNSDQVKEQFSYKNGILHGEAITWYKNGQIRRKGNYCKGQISGKWEFWDNNGNKLIEANYKNNNLNGSYVALYANGKVKERGRFIDNKPAGNWCYYTESGKQNLKTAP